MRRLAAAIALVLAGTVVINAAAIVPPASASAPTMQPGFAYTVDADDGEVTAVEIADGLHIEKACWVEGTDLYCSNEWVR